MTQLLLDLLPAPQPTFENLVVGANAEAIAAVRRLCSTVAIEPSQRFLYLWGEAGSGRSHLVRAACAAIDGRVLGASDASATTIRAAMDPSIPLVAIDDVDRIDSAAQEALFHVINLRRADPRAAMIVTGNAAPRDLALDKAREDLRSRLAWGLVYRLESLDDLQKDAALTQHAEDRGFPLSADVRRYLLTHCARDLGALMQLVDTVDRHAREQQRIVTVPLIREFMQRDLPLNVSETA